MANFIEHNGKFYAHPDSWVEVLGVINIFTPDGEWVSYEEAHEFVKTLKLKNAQEFRKHIKEGQQPKDLPASPDKVYKGIGWVSWNEFLGN